MCGSFPGLLIGRTAVHSGKDPAFVAYDQFLSTGILQPLSRGEVRGSFASILPCPLSCPLSPLPDSCSAADRSYSITSSARASNFQNGRFLSSQSFPASVIVDDTDDEAVVKEKQEKALAEHVARHPEDVGRKVEDFNWILSEIVRSWQGPPRLGLSQVGHNGQKA
jgi:hypothetical protein